MNALLVSSLSAPSWQRATNMAFGGWRTPPSAACSWSVMETAWKYLRIHYNGAMSGLGWGDAYLERSTARLRSSIGSISSSTRLEHGGGSSAMAM